jgi:c(7)-type cytochrome triheme protein
MKTEKKSYIRAMVVAITVLLFGPLLADNFRLAENNSNTTVTPEPSFADYSKFTHTNPEHARLPCLLCHRREDNSAQPKRSVGHLPCTGCHTQQFNDSSSPICTICHVSNQSKELKPFPRMKTFDTKFSHARHSSGGARPRGGCATCHKPVNRGVAKSIPTGISAHNTCFQCHVPKAKAGDRDISSCGTCHVLGRPTRPSIWARAYKVNFSHSKHSSGRLSCTDCHLVSSGQSKVISPNPLMHHVSPRARSCATCHNGVRAFGDNDFANCKRCHLGNTFKF